MHDFSNISKNFYKIKKIWTEQGLRIVLKKVLHLAEKSLLRSASIRTLEKRNIIFKNVDNKILNKEIKLFFCYGLLRSPNDIKLEIKSLPSDLTDWIVQEGKRILRNEFILYGRLKVNFGVEGFSWLRDPLSGFIWPLNVHPDKVGTQKPVGTDVKNLWEIARFQFLFYLAYNHILTGDERFSRFAVEKISLWFKENPFLQGPHWSRAMEASIRLMNWCVYLPLLDVFNVSDSSFQQRLARSILEHFIYIRENLEVSPSQAGNHYLADLIGLLLAGVLFPKVEWARETYEFAIGEFEKEVLRQFNTSGLNFEGSLPYHRLSSEMCVIGLALIKKYGLTVSPKIIERLKRISEFTKYYSDICEEIPIIGDNDSGLCVKYYPGQESNRHEYLNLLLDIFIRGKSKPKNYNDFMCSVHFTETELPDDSKFEIEDEESNDHLQVREFDGLIIARQNREGIFFNTIHSTRGHSHNDKLTVYPIIGKKLLFLDRGSFSYTGFIKKRHIDRLTSCHNGPVVNDWEQSRIWKNDPFYLNGDAKCGNRIDCQSDMVDIVGWHTGYERYRKNLKTFRKIEWDIRKRTILITDWVEGNESHDLFQFKWKFLINPAWVGEIEHSSLLLTSADSTVRFENVNGIDFNLSQDIYCPSYQIESQCQALKARCMLACGEKINFLLHY